MSTRKTARPNLPSTRTAAPSAAQRRLAADRAAAARVRIAEAQRRRQWLIVGGSIVGIIVIVAALVIVKVATNAGAPKSGDKASAADAAVLRSIASVPPSAFNQVGVGSASGKPIPISGTSLTKGGKPEILYIGAEYCPYCAAERWAMAVALSRFGTLHDVGETSSSPSDVYPSTATLTFHGSTYTSSVLAFTPREVESNQVVNGNYAPLDKLTAGQQQIYAKYDAKPYVQSSGIPFIYIAGKYIVVSASYDPGLLQGKSHDQIAAALSDPSSSIAQGVLGTANLITAAICSVTNQQPTAVCTSAGVRAAAAAISPAK